MNNKKIAQIIVEQLGGYGKLRMMVGAVNLVAIDNGLSFKFKGNRKFTHARIVLNGMDLYDVEYIKVGGTKVTTVKISKGLYNDMLKKDFTSTTGLYLSL